MTATSTNNLESMLSARRADLAGTSPTVPTAMGDDVIEGEVIPPADQTTGEILPEAGNRLPAPAGPVETVFPIVPPKVLGGIPYARDYVKLAVTIMNTEMVPVELRGRKEAITACFLRGYEMGIPPMQALDSFNVIQGKVGLKPEAMRALIMDNGHDIILEDLYDGEGKLYGILAQCHRASWPEDRWQEYRFTLQDAAQMGLTGKDNWKKMPRAMLDARATAGAGRRYFADILAGMSYTPEEIRDFGRAEQEAPPSPPPPPTPAPGLSAPQDAPTTAAPSDSAAEPAPAPPSSPSPSSTVPSTDGPTDNKPKKPRGRPKKQTPETIPAPASAEPTPAPSMETPPPEQGTLDPEAPPCDEDPSESIVDGGPVDEASVLRELQSGLRSCISSQPAHQQSLLRAFLVQHFPLEQYPNGAADLDSEQLTKAINIAGGWPGSADAYPPPASTEDPGF
jgi:hypothetical protein